MDIFSKGFCLYQIGTYIIAPTSKKKIIYEQMQDILLLCLVKDFNLKADVIPYFICFFKLFGKNSKGKVTALGQKILKSGIIPESELDNIQKNNSETKSKRRSPVKLSEFTFDLASENTR